MVNLVNNLLLVQAGVVIVGVVVGIVVLLRIGASIEEIRKKSVSEDLERIYKRIKGNNGLVIDGLKVISGKMSDFESVKDIANDTRELRRLLDTVLGILEAEGSIGFVIEEKENSELEAEQIQN